MSKNIKMETILKKLPHFQISDRTKKTIVEAIIYLFIALFVYTAYSKFKTIEEFKNILGKSPLIGTYNVIVAWAVPSIEIIITTLLILPFTKKNGLLASLVLMVSFSLFLTYGILSGSKLPCRCGGVISSLSWSQHIWFNLGFIILALIGLKIYKKE